MDSDPAELLNFCSFLVRQNYWFEKTSSPLPLSCWYDNRIPTTKKAMDVIIQSLGFKASEHLESYVKEKLGKLSPNDHIIRANVVLFQGPDRSTPNDYCEIRLEVPGPDHFVKEHSAHFEQAIDEAVNKLQSMMRRAKEKIIDRNRSEGDPLDQLMNEQNRN